MNCLAAAVLTAYLAVAIAQKPASGAVTLPENFGLIEAQTREALDPTGQAFLVDINDPQQSSGYEDQYGSIRYVIGQSNKALFTLPSNGLAQQAVALQGCAVWTPHYHPRSSEILYVTKGNLQMAFSEENEVALPNNVVVGGKVFNYTVKEGQSLIVPQALMHYVYNPSCDPATITTFFDNKDPGIVSVTGKLFQYDPVIISATTGLDAFGVHAASETVTNSKVIGQDEACAKKCDPNSSANTPLAASPEGLSGSETAKAPSASNSAG